jgi:hypothetical protein
MCGRVDKVVGVVRTHLAPELQMEGESLGHALFEIEPEPLTQPEGSGPLVTTYSCSMLVTAPMAHDTCPYFRITGTKGEIVIHGDGLFKEKPGAGGLHLYDEDNPTGKELFPADHKGGNTFQRLSRRRMVMPPIRRSFELQTMCALSWHCTRVRKQGAGSSHRTARLFTY